MISVIVPIYNSGKYLKKCIESIVNQTYKDLEIILVDDGSVDKSGSICDEYADKDKRIKVVHQENKGLSAARNAGLRIAKGEYITFIDSDDYIEHDTYECVFSAINKYDSDLIFFREKSVNESGETIYISGDAPTGKIYEISHADAVDLVVGRQINGMCDKVYKQEILKDLFFKEGYMYGEDFMYNLVALTRVKTVSYVDEIKYSYVSNSSSVTHRSFNANSFDQIYFKDEVARIVGENFPQHLEVCKKRAFLARLRVCRPIYNENLQKQYKEKLNEFDGYMRMNFKSVQKQMSVLELVEYRLYMNFKPFYKVFSKIVKSLRK